MAAHIWGQIGVKTYHFMSNIIGKIAIVLIVLIAFIDGILVAQHFSEETEQTDAEEAIVNIEDVFTDDSRTGEHSFSSELHEVPFTTQAIHGWVSPWDQYAEEACMYMAWLWISGQEIGDAGEIADDLLAMGTWENRNLGTSGDTSPAETIQIMTAYYSHLKSFLLDNPDLDRLKTELENGSIVALTINGQFLDSEYYGDPAPEHHMVLIVGFDQEQQSFIVNDPGTVHGAQIYYPYEKVLGAISDSAIVIYN